MKLIIIYIIFGLSLRLAHYNIIIHFFQPFHLWVFILFCFVFFVNWLQLIFMEYFKKVNRFTFFLSSLYFEWLLSFKIIPLQRKLSGQAFIFLTLNCFLLCHLGFNRKCEEFQFICYYKYKVNLYFWLCFWTFYGKRFLPHSYLFTCRCLENDVTWTIVNPFITHAVNFFGLESISTL